MEENEDYRKGYWRGLQDGIERTMKSRLKIVLSNPMIQEAYEQLPENKITIEEFEKGLRLFVDRVNEFYKMEKDGERN